MSMRYRVIKNNHYDDDDIIREFTGGTHDIVREFTGGTHDIAREFTSGSHDIAREFSGGPLEMYLSVVG